MAEKRIIVAMALSLTVVLLWSRFLPKPYPIENKTVTTQTAAVGLTSSAPLTPVLSNLPEPALEKLSFPGIETVFIPSQAAIKEASFPQYRSGKLLLKSGFLVGGPEMVFTAVPSSSQEASFIYTDKAKKISKRFLFSNSKYAMDLEIKIENMSNLPLDLDLPIMLGTLDFATDPATSRLQDVAMANAEGVNYPSPHKETSLSGIKFLSLRNQYFCAIIQPENSGYAGFVRKVQAKESAIGLAKKWNILPGQVITEKFRIYLGPQELKYMNPLNPDWSAVIYYGKLNIIAHLLMQLLDILQRLTHNWGVAIVLLSVLIYFLLYPLSLKQMRSMKEMQALQPKIEEVRKRNKDNPQKLNKEVMELYREHKVNPLGGCLPLILQMPIFFALYQALMRSVALKGATFLWIKDLSEPDRLFSLPFGKPFDAFNLLPILMMIGMFLQQKLSATSASGVSNEQQKMMLIVFPLMFGFIFYSMPAGLVLYWFINSTLMLIYQVRIARTK